MRRKNWRQIKGRACRITLKKFGSVVEIVDAIPIPCALPIFFKVTEKSLTHPVVRATLRES